MLNTLLVRMQVSVMVGCYTGKYVYLLEGYRVRLSWKQFDRSGFARDVDSRPGSGGGAGAGGGRRRGAGRVRR